MTCSVLTKWRLGVLAALIGSCAVGAHASGRGEPLVLEGYEGMRTARLISTGRYDEIIARRPQLARLDRRGAATLATNLCVAYIKTARLEEARGACDAAIVAARTDKATATASWAYSAGERTLGMARSYSNRAVLNWVSGDHAAAAADLARAAAYAPRAHFVTRNAAAFATRGALPLAARQALIEA